MFEATLKDREHSFRVAPGTSMFIHWLVGMVYIFYFASFILLLREVLRPGVLWFLRNINDPDFSPIQEVRHLMCGIVLSRVCCVSGPVSTWMGDHLRAGIQSWFVTSQLGQLSLVSLWDRLIEYQLWFG